MIDESVRHIVEPELREGEELLWVGQSDLKKLRHKATLMQSFVALFIALIMFGMFYLLTQETGLIEISIVALMLAGILIWQLKKAFKTADELAKNIYAATNTDFITIGYDPDTGSKFVDRVPYTAMKAVHKMSIAKGASITFVLKGGLIPNTKQFFIDGFDKDTRLYKIVKQKINYI